MSGDYVNSLPEEYPADTPRCQHRFYLGSGAGGELVSGRWCGLPAQEGEGAEARCYFHHERGRAGDEEVRLRLERAVERGAFLGEAHLAGAALDGAQLAGAQLTGANLQGASLRGADLQGAMLQGAALPGAVVERAQLQGATLVLADLPGANLRMAKLQGASLMGTELQGADLRRADLGGAWLPEANLHHADLRHAHLGTTLVAEEGGNLTPKATDLSGADLRGTLLAEARIDPEVRLEGARWTDPATAGARPPTMKLARTWSRYALADERCRLSAEQWAAWQDQRWAVADLMGHYWPVWQ
jgi:uncharacterized protein YjbI with pentapeptide repeats